MSVICAKCKKPTTTYSWILWRKGPRGFRRYPICRTCEKDIEAEGNPAGMKAMVKP